MWSIKCYFCFLAFLGYSVETRKPHLIFIVADDLGWNDIGYRNPRVYTPTLDRLARQGVILNQSYVQPICTPSRSAFMTGYYPYHIGTQNNVFMKMSPDGVPAKFKLLPQYLRELGYSTHLVGKWHLGFCHWNYTPNYRGFDSFLGYYAGDEQYYSHRSQDFTQGAHADGIDFRFNKKVLLNKNGTYSTAIFVNRVRKILRNSSPEKPLFLNVAFQSVHSPLQVPKRYLKRFKNVNDRNRRIYLAMVLALDEAISYIIDDLKRFNFYNNSVIVFTTDNGGQVYSGGNNWPLRGNKFRIWEGGTRGNAFVHSSLLSKTNRIHSGMIHAVDWAPTFVHLAGGNLTTTDGVNQWEAISKGEKSPRNEFVYNIYFNGNHTPSGIRVGKFKYIRGFPGEPSGWIPEPHVTLKNISVVPETKYLFNIEEDPTERINLVGIKPNLVQMLDARLEYLARSSEPAQPAWSDLNSNPKFWNDAWSPGWCDYE